MKPFNIILFLFIQTGVLLTAPMPEELNGLWQGLVRGTGSHYHDTVLVSLQFNDDGSVQGYIGNAELKECQYKENRHALGRFLNLKSDHIITDGIIQGSVFPGDNSLNQGFTLPFNLTETGQIRGGVMLLYRWKYPSPLLGPVILDHKD